MSNRVSDLKELQLNENNTYASQPEQNIYDQSMYGQFDGMYQNQLMPGGQYMGGNMLMNNAMTGGMTVNNMAGASSGYYYSAENNAMNGLSYMYPYQDMGKQMMTPNLNMTDSYMNMEDSGLPEAVTNPIYTAGFLRTQIGKYMRVDFLVGGSVIEKTGVLTAVGASYILLHTIEPNGLFMCDLHSIKFATISNAN